MLDVGHVLVGSQNYHLDGPCSDKDYKVLLCPEVNDFYFNKRVEKNDVPKGLDKEHYNPIDVRAFDRNLRAGNPNCLEMLWSQEYENLDFELKLYIDEARDMFERGYLVMVFQPFFKAVKGLVFNPFSRNGVNRKTASRAMFFYHFIGKVASNDFAVKEEFWTSNAARELRFNETIDIPTLEDFQYNFRAVENPMIEEAEKTLQKLTLFEYQMFQERASSLQYRMQRFVFDKLEKELNNQY